MNAVNRYGDQTNGKFTTEDFGTWTARTRILAGRSRSLFPHTINSLYYEDGMTDYELTQLRQVIREEISAALDQALHKSKRTKWTPPTFTEVEAYCKERNRGVSPGKWYAHYTANGWKVGRNPMKDWKAAVRTWEEDDFHNLPQKPLVKCAIDDNDNHAGPAYQRYKE
jgi:hypothetical protein